MKSKELKTLKDIEFVEHGHLPSQFKIKQKIKAEAIKWLKKNFNEDWSDNDLNYLDWMEFFNITEENFYEEQKRKN
ncbi:MAG TPA: hypothetical protein VMV95_02690 [Bacillota bacterium]|nr:hypothetical protein [Bacillota bacterium]